MQIELLYIYGGDVCQPDEQGMSAYELAQRNSSSNSNNNSELAERIVQLEYECTDRLTMYLCGRRAKHDQQQHFVVPEMSAVSEAELPIVTLAKRRLQVCHIYYYYAML